LEIAVVIVGQRLVAEGRLMVGRIVRSCANRLWNAGPGKGATDLGPTSWFMVGENYTTPLLVLLKPTNHLSEFK
jgi:hypothetical protein